MLEVAVVKMFSSYFPFTTTDGAQPLPRNNLVETVYFKNYRSITKPTFFREHLTRSENPDFHPAELTKELFIPRIYIKIKHKERL